MIRIDYQLNQFIYDWLLSGTRPFSYGGPNCVYAFGTIYFSSFTTIPAAHGLLATKVHRFASRRGGWGGGGCSSPSYPHLRMGS